MPLQTFIPSNVNLVGHYRNSTGQEQNVAVSYIIAQGIHSVVMLNKSAMRSAKVGFHGSLSELLTN